MTIFDISIFGIHLTATWYGFMYAIGFLICYTYIKKYGYIKNIHLDSFLFFMFIGVVVGGRLGYVILYNLSYFSLHPFEIFSVWKGGMSFHGGMMGVIGALIIFSYRYKYRLFDVSDPLVFIVPLALGLGRIGNYINKELLGYSPYDGPLGIIKDGVRHFPSPLFQAFLEGVILLSCMQIYALYEKRKKRIPGYASALFLVGYGSLRIIAEGSRLPDPQIGYLFGTHFITLGMIYSIPMILLGVVLSIASRKQS